jgi:hypothetical protein
MMNREQATAELIDCMLVESKSDEVSQDTQGGVVIDERMRGHCTLKNRLWRRCEV